MRETDPRLVPLEPPRDIDPALRVVGIRPREAEPRDLELGIRMVGIREGETDRPEGIPERLGETLLERLVGMRDETEGARLDRELEREPLDDPPLGTRERLRGEKPPERRDAAGDERRDDVDGTTLRLDDGVLVTRDPLRGVNVRDRLVGVEEARRAVVAVGVTERAVLLVVPVAPETRERLRGAKLPWLPL